MAEALKGIYNRRHPERTDYYSPIEAFEDRRIIEGSFEELKYCPTSVPKKQSVHHHSDIF